jgi:hypothetical protein
MATKKQTNEEKMGCGESLIFLMIIFIFLWGGLTIINVKIEKINFINTVNKDVFGNNSKFVSNDSNENYDPLSDVPFDEQELSDSGKEESLETAPKGFINCDKCNGSGKIDFCDNVSCNNGYIHCRRCVGDGVESSGKVCLQCQGNGLVLCDRCNGEPSSLRNCYKCEGEKYLEMITCRQCGKELNEDDEYYSFGKGELKCIECWGAGGIVK